MERAAHDLQVVRPNRRELPVSVLLAAWLILAPMTAPIAPIHYLLDPFLILVSLFCALNAVLDWRRMGRFERVFAWCWFVLVLIGAMLIVGSVSRVTYFADA